MNIQDSEDLGKTTTNPHDTTLQHSPLLNPKSKSESGKTTPSNIPNPPTTYLKCIELIQGTFLDSTSNESKTIAFYLKSIQSLLRANQELSKNVLKVQNQNDSAYREISELRNAYKERHSTKPPQPADQKSKRKRRKAKEIKRLYTCNVDNCQKNYGSQGALAYHMKIKHPEVQISLPKLNSGTDENPENPIQTLGEQESTYKRVLKAGGDQGGAE